MPQPKFEVAVGPVDGTNRTFTVSSGYLPGSSAVFLNGQLKQARADDGWAETNPSGGVLTLDLPPAAGDVVQVFFTALVPHAEVEEEVTVLRGLIRETEGLQGSFREAASLRGAAEVTGTLSGRLGALVPLRGAIVALDSLSGRLREES